MAKFVRRIFFCALAAFCAFLAFGSFLVPPTTSIGENSMSFTVMGIIFAALAVLFVILAINPKKNRREKAEKGLAEYQRLRIEEVRNTEQLPAVEFPSAPVIFKDGEICHYETDASVVIIREKVVGYTGGSAGVSVRVAKGISLRSGSSKGRPIRQDVARDYPGIFLITNQRVVMTGEKGFEYPLQRLTSLTPWDGFQGIILQFGRVSYIVRMSEPYWVPKIIDLLSKTNLT